MIYFIAGWNDSKIPGSVPIEDQDDSMGMAYILYRIGHAIGIIKGY